MRTAYRGRRGQVERDSGLKEDSATNPDAGEFGGLADDVSSVLVVRKLEKVVSGKKKGTELSATRP